MATWNLFHGRDFPPDPSLFTLRSRLLRVTEVGATYAQVNRPLLHEFAGVLSGLDWHVAFLQEAPPRWLDPLRRATGAEGERVLTARNWLGGVRGRLADLNPDLVASNEGGSNQLLVRPPWRIVDVRRLAIAERPERRAMIYAELAGPDGARVAVANLHGTTGHTSEAAVQVVAAGESAAAWAGELPLVLGGDLNIRPRRLRAPYDELQGLGFDAPADDGAIDHLLARGATVTGGPRALAASVREVPGPQGRVIRLSDHPIVAAAYELG